MHIYFKATALDTIFTLLNRINNKETKNTNQVNLLQVDRQVVVTLLGSPDSTSLDLRLILVASSRSRSPCSRAHTCSLVSVFLQKLYCVFLHTASSRISVFSLLVLITHVLCFLCLFSVFHSLFSVLLSLFFCFSLSVCSH